MLRNAVTNRRNLTPQPPAGTPAGAVADGQHAMRRGGARREVSTRVFLRDTEGKVAHEGWALNVSRGGVRAILEDRVEPGAEFEVESARTTARRAAAGSSGSRRSRTA